nr:MAG TPA: E3 ubiquitin-protein ligase [Caudoviricetes sp.]
MVDWVGLYDPRRYRFNVSYLAMLGPTVSVRNVINVKAYTSIL